MEVEEEVDRGLLRKLPRGLVDSSALSGALLIIAVFLASLVVGALVVAIVGVSPFAALEQMFVGAVGSSSALANSLVYATPRLLVALGALVAIRSGVFNLGGEGQLQMGAIGATLAGTMLGTFFAPAHLIVALVAAMAFGAAWAVAAIALKILRGADEIIVTLMMNFIAIYFVKYLVQGPLQPEGSIYSTSAPIANTAHLPIIWEGTRLHAGFLLAVGGAIVAWMLLYRSPLGLQFRAAGDNASASRVQGLSVARLIIVSMAISGAFAGLAGAGEILGVQYELIDGFSASLGFEGLAIAFLGGLQPIPVILVAIYFGMVQNGATQLEATLGVPASLALIMQALPIIFLAAARGWLVLKGRASA